MNLPKPVVWFVPAFQVGMACVVAWAISSGRLDAHGDLLTASIVIDVVLLMLFFVKRNMMLRPDQA